MELIIILFSLTFSLLRCMKLIKWPWIWIFAPMWMWGLVLLAIILYTSMSCESCNSNSIDEFNFQLPESVV